MRKEILLSALLFAAGSIFAQYKIDLGKVTPPTVKYLQLGRNGPVGKESALITCIWKKVAFLNSP